MMAAALVRRQVLGLYKKIHRLSRTWNAIHSDDTPDQRNYIKEEARYWFRRNKMVSDPQAIQDHIREGEARLEMGININTTAIIIICIILT